jgi:hypothetical protein
MTLDRPGNALKTAVVVHVNHANEIDASVITALAGLKASGANCPISPCYCAVSMTVPRR